MRIFITRKEATVTRITILGLVFVTLIPSAVLGQDRGADPIGGGIPVDDYAREPQVSGQPSLVLMGPLARAAARAAVRTMPDAGPQASRRGGWAPRARRLGWWAAIPGLFVGGFLGAAADCAAGSCSTLPAGLGVGMIAGAVAAVAAPRKIAGAFLGGGAGAIAGALAGGAIEGDCSAAKPCDKGAGVGASVGALAGGAGGYRLAGR